MTLSLVREREMAGPSGGGRKDPPQLDELSMLLGSIKNELEIVTRTLAENRIADAQYRTSIRAEIKQIDDKLDNMTNEHVAMKHNVQNLMPLIPRVEKLEERAAMGKGASNLVEMFGRVGHVISAAFGGVFAILFEKWWNHH